MGPRRANVRPRGWNLGQEARQHGERYRIVPARWGTALMAGHFYLDPDVLLDPASKVNLLRDHAFRFGWMALVAAAAEREDTYFDDADLALLDGFDAEIHADLLRVRLLKQEGDGWRLSDYGWRIENEGAR